MVVLICYRLVSLLIDLDNFGINNFNCQAKCKTVISLEGCANHEIGHEERSTQNIILYESEIKQFLPKIRCCHYSTSPILTTN